MCQSLYACRTTCAVCRSGCLKNFSPHRLGNDGKHIDASTPLAFMSRMRSWMLYVPGRSCEYAVGSIPYSSGGRPTTAFRATLGICSPCHTHTSLPSGFLTACGAFDL